VNRTSLYSAETNELVEQAQVRKPEQPDIANYAYSIDAYWAHTQEYDERLAEYNAHIASLRRIPCQPEPGFVNQQSYEQDKDYVIKTAGDWKWCYQLKGNIFAAPLTRAEDELNNWLTEKPKIDKECIVITAHKWNNRWTYTLYTVEKVDGEGGWYWGLIAEDGAEWGDIADLAAEKYLILEPLKR
jgi:hypothetical protein